MSSDRLTPFDKFDKIPPQSLEGEQAVLGAMLLDRQAIEKARAILRKEDFYRDAHNVIFDAIVKLAQRGEPVDLLTVREQLRVMEMLEKVGGAPYLIQLQNAVPAAANAEYYADIVEEKRILRSLLDASNQIQSLVHGEYESIDEVLAHAERMVRDVGLRRRMPGAIRSLADAIEQVFQSALERRTAAESGGSTLAGLSTGFDDLDYVAQGIEPGELVVIAARPKLGKSALVMSMAHHAAKSGVPVLIFSLEMPAEQIARRLLSMDSRIPASHIRSGLMQPSEWERLGEACDALSTLPVWIDDTPGLTMGELRAKTLRHKQACGLGMLVVDYLQIMSPDRTRSPFSEGRVAELGAMTRALKTLALEQNLPVFALSQLNRAVEQRADKRPMLSDLRESGAIEQDADRVWFIYRDAYYKRKEVESAQEQEQARRTQRGEDEVEVAEIIVAAQRSGASGGTVELAWHPATTRFTNLERHHGD